MFPRPLRLAVIGAGPAGIYAADIVAAQAPGTQIDLFEKLPAPFGLVRYGVSPDHPRIKKIVESLHEMLDGSDVRLFCNVEIGRDLSIAELRERYDAVLVATGANDDARLEIPGVDLPGSFGAADFVSWYDGHPDVPEHWPLHAESIAVLGAGNVALDVTRMLAKHAADLADTDVSPNVADGLAANPVRTVHLFARRGPADARFSAMELRELGQQRDVDVIVDRADIAVDEHTARMAKQFGQRRINLATLTGWAERDPAERTASRRVHLHFYETPVRLEGDTGVTAIVTERGIPNGYGQVTPSGQFRSTPVQAVYRAIGYNSRPLPGLPFDEASHTIPNDEGRVLAADGAPLPGVYATGWVKRGPVGLIGSTKSDALQTVTHLLADLGERSATSGLGQHTPEGAGNLLAERNIRPVDWAGWLAIDRAESDLGAADGRARVKIHRRQELTDIGWSAAAERIG
ncbi:FAD-dependent oxidoreductase [Leucobacter sp. M11]|uniref:FAD-dependent oxidoreductase n=1 Tax=Leucobacter sp. M11 TaxID=2993565 RepID=UPI002D7EDFDA|nr:FAD-dependent oxidoreductase [Leucobacter sp. M11]MEB4615051.1 FAD-dependent oxidoreductase [Leucobacter sp. M11]